jgi:hypothetical protein
MGLDSLWKDNDGNDGVIPQRFKVCGGLFSGNFELGNDSFRGKVYENLIVEVTGESLYQELIPNEKIKVMNDALQKAKYEDVKDLGMYELIEEEWNSFKAMWQAHSDAGHNLVGWW